MNDSQVKRQKVRLSGNDSLRDVAIRVFKDARLTPLFRSLNPAHDPQSVLPKDSVIVLPTIGEAQRFAKERGYTLGYDPSKEGATRVRRSWKKHQGGERVVRAIDPEKLVATLNEEDYAIDLIAEKMIQTLSPQALQEFIKQEHESSEMKEVAEFCEKILLRREIEAFIRALKDVFKRTQQVENREKLFSRLALNEDESKTMLLSLLMSSKLIDDLALRARELVPMFSLAAEIAATSEYDRDALINAHYAPDVLGALVSAKADGLELFEDARLELLGVEAMVRALDQHLDKLLGGLNKVTDTMERAPLKALRSIITGENVGVPSPWILLRKLHAALGALLKRVHAGKREDGLAALIAPGDGSKISRMSAAELAARAAHNARIVDEHEGVAEQLAPNVAALFDVFKPTAPDRGQQAQVRGRRRTRFEKAIFAKRDEEGDSAKIEDALKDIFARAERGHDKALREALENVPRGAQKNAYLLCEAMTGTLVVMLRGASNETRALLIAAALLDRELCEKLSRDTGREAVAQALKKHAARIVSLATSLYAELHEKA